jgi:hypothetical protein
MDAVIKTEEGEAAVNLSEQSPLISTSPEDSSSGNNNLTISKGSPKQTITPIQGDLTQFWIDVVGTEDKRLEDKRDRETAMILDGLKVAESEYRVYLNKGFTFAGTPEFSSSRENFRSIGFKIHANLKTEDIDYVEKMRKIAELCLNKNREGKSTTFKVMTCSFRKSLEEYDPDQSRKLITIYPTYLTNENTNVSETIRLVAGLREILGTDILGEEESVFKEHASGKGIYLRAGAFSREGQEYESVSKEDSFEEQLKGNLSSPRTDGKLFETQVNNAINKGLL